MKSLIYVWHGEWNGDRFGAERKGRKKLKYYFEWRAASTSHTDLFLYIEYIQLVYQTEKKKEKTAIDVPKKSVVRFFNEISFAVNRIGFVSKPFGR